MSNRKQARRMCSCMGRVQSFIPQLLYVFMGQTEQSLSSLPTRMGSTKNWQVKLSVWGRTSWGSWVCSLSCHPTPVRGDSYHPISHTWATCTVTYGQTGVQVWKCECVINVTWSSEGTLQLSSPKLLISHLSNFITMFHLRLSATLRCKIFGKRQINATQTYCTVWLIGSMLVFFYWRVVFFYWRGEVCVLGLPNSCFGLACSNKVVSPFYYSCFKVSVKKFIDWIEMYQWITCERRNCFYFEYSSGKGIILAYFSFVPLTLLALRTLMVALYWCLIHWFWLE